MILEPCRTYAPTEYFVGHEPSIEKLEIIEQAEIPKSSKKKKYYQKPRDVYLMETYGITLEQFEALKEFQNGKCATCKIPEEELKEGLYVDHDHESGQVRGLLCRGCNFGLGYFKDNQNVLQSAISYLGEPPAKQAGISTNASQTT